MTEYSGYEFCIGKLFRQVKPASAPVVSSFYDKFFAGIAIIMGLFGAAIGNFVAMGVGVILHLLA